ncbi:MAG: hypothetical protein H7X79_05695 [Sporomusaceae bacterium]|nr:hypothetical protein [Sporomusaceae bacterium]
MNSFHQKYSILFLILLLTLFSSSVIAAQSKPPSEPFHLTGHVYYSTIEGGFYGIISDDGIKYQPINLPRKFKKEGLSLKFDAKLRDKAISFFQWGTIIEMSNVSEFVTDISKDERKAITILRKRIDAFNSKDLGKLQKVDEPSRKLTQEQFDSWVNQYNNYTLQYVDLFSADSTEITGACYYTREFTNGMTRYGTTDLAAMAFTISKMPQGWKVTQVGNLQNPIFNYETDALADLKKKTIEKYKMDSLTAFGQ